MNKLSTHAKEAIIQKVLAKDGRTLNEIAKAHNVGASSLNRWLKIFRGCGTITDQKTGKVTQVIPVSERFQHLIATASLNETDVGVYCRGKGIYSFQLTEWKNAFMTDKANEKEQSLLAELTALRLENKQLKQDVRRKDSALAEVSALLILKKKAALIWGEAEDD